MENAVTMSTDLPSESSITSARRPTLKTIAYLTGLGVTTVSRALKDAPEIGEETKNRVRLVAKQVGYRPNRAGVRLRTGKTHVISLVLNTQEEMLGMVSEMILGISQALENTPYHLVVSPYFLSDDPMDPIRYVVETKSADGVIISRTEPDDPRVAYLQEHGFPFATHGRTKSDAAHAWHDFDNFEFGRQAVHWLANKGRRRIAFMPPPDYLLYAEHMTEGFVKGLQETGTQEVDFRHITPDTPLREIEQASYDLVRSDRPPDGMLAGSGGAAVAAIAGVERAGLKLRQEIDVVTKQTSQYLQWFRPGLDAYYEDIPLAGRELAHAVLRQIAGDDPATLQSLCAPVAPTDSPLDPIAG
jgi:LacI family transcriptional regulator